MTLIFGTHLGRQEKIDLKRMVNTLDNKYPKLLNNNLWSWNF